MGKIYELNNNLNKIITMLTSNQNLCKLLYYNSSNDPTSETDIPDTKILIKNNIIPKPFITDVLSNTVCVMTVYFDSISARGGQLENITIRFDIICHESLYEIKGGIRPYSIIEELIEILDGRYVIGLGRTYFSNVRQIAVNESYKGYMITFSCDDFKV